MAQFDVLLNRTGFLQDIVPYFLDIQNDFAESVGTRVVVPLRATAHSGRLVSRLNPIFDVDDQTVAMMTLEITTMTNARLGPSVASLEQQRDQIIAAIDFLISGF